MAKGGVMPITGAEVRAEWDRQARALPQETRQRFLDAVWEGKTIGAAAEIAGITLHEALGTINLNLTSTTSLRKESV